jgi:hypothetical protein
VSVLDWEDPQHRVILNPELQDLFGLENPVLRWNADKRRRNRADRRNDPEVIDDLSTYLDDWEFAGMERDHPGNWRALFWAKDRWYAVSFGPDGFGRFNTITVVGSKKPGHKENRLRGMVNIVERGK